MGSGAFKCSVILSWRFHMCEESVLWISNVDVPLDFSNINSLEFRDVKYFQNLLNVSERTSGTSKLILLELATKFYA